MARRQHPRRRDRFRLREATGPLRRDTNDRLGGGVASGIAAWRNYNATTIRILFVLLTVVTTGTGVALYVAGWLFIAASDQEHSIAVKARKDSRGIALAIGLGTLLTVALLITGVFNDGWFSTWVWPQVFSLAGLTLIWRNAPLDEQASLRRLVEPLEAAAGSSVAAPNRRSAIRLILAAVLLLAGVGWLASEHAQVALLRPLGAVALIIASVVLFLGPWWLRIGRDLMVERQARVRAEERAEIASKVHDSVLQTLALIQRRADDPHKVVQLARIQERELREWLFEGKAPGEVRTSTFAAAVKQIQQDVETRYGVPVEAVLVGDCDLDDNLTALVAAAREATINAAKWSGASVISLFGEVGPAEVELVVRDRGKGFDPAQVSPDRKGLAESVHGRMIRRGGTAIVVSELGEGTKVTLRMPRPAAAATGQAGSRA